MSNGTQSIDRAAGVLTFVVSADSAVSFTDVVTHTGLSRPTASRLLAALERNGLLHRESDGRYRGGALFASYAARFDRTGWLTAASGPTLQRLSGETGETVNLAVAAGDQVVQIAQLDSTYLLGTTNWMDIDVPAHCSALGKVLYAFGALPVPTSRLEKRTAQTVTDATALRAELETVRENGFAVARDELEDGLTAYAAPVFDGDGSVVAAVGISGPTGRLDEEHERIGRLLVHEATTLSKSLARRTTP
ncbi:MAG TPA: IclR family transcriptional regulator [Microbacterium sp.]|nr:IclR family transcriptional regulator [Microbacterium sp.]